MPPVIIPQVIIRSSDIHAAGCFALEKIPAGVRVLEYTGDRMAHKDADELYKGRPYTYLFGVGDGETVIDGYGMAMYVNHSCTPNCETEEDDDNRVWIMSIREIQPGEELVYDYFLYDGDGDAPCTCGTPNCRGTMYSPKEIARRKRAATKLANATKKQNGAASKRSGPTTSKSSGQKKKRVR
ncbi:MAG TPA: SET domain-containing protein-lysine N-methyltransferase [Clostridia bacterium]|nr:SET domain-containing protein-lysine N-methyltransferase [Clostridia bacterium]